MAGRQGFGRFSLAEEVRRTSHKSCWRHVVRVIPPLPPCCPPWAATAATPRPWTFPKPCRSPSQRPLRRTPETPQGRCGHDLPQGTPSPSAGSSRPTSAGSGASNWSSSSPRRTPRSTNCSRGAVDVAFICSGPYASGKQKFGLELLAIPGARGSHFSHSCRIVGKDSPAGSLPILRASASPSPTGIPTPGALSRCCGSGAVRNAAVCRGGRPRGPPAALRHDGQALRNLVEAFLRKFYADAPPPPRRERRVFLGRGRPGGESARRDRAPPKRTE